MDENEAKLFEQATTEVREAIEDTQETREKIKKTLSSIEHYYAVFTPADGGWVVRFPDVPGALTEGSTVEEALVLAADALSAILAMGRKGHDYFAPRSYAEIAEGKGDGDLVFPVSLNEAIRAECGHQGWGGSIAIKRGDELNMEEFSWHEALDRTSLVLELFERSVCDHPVIRNMSDLQEKAVKISDLLSELYQDIGAKEKIDKPGWISYADVEKADADFLLSQSCGESALGDLAETMVKSTQGLLSRIDELEKRLDDTHVLLAGKLKS